MGRFDGPVRFYEQRQPRSGLVVGTVLGSAAFAALAAPDVCERAAATAADRHAIYSAGVTVTGGLLGFAIAALALLADHLAPRPVEDQPGPPRFAVTDRHRALIVDIFVSLARAAGVSTVLGVAGLFATNHRIAITVLALWCACLGVMLTQGSEAIRLLGLIVRGRAVNSAQSPGTG